MKNSTLRNVTAIIAKIIEVVSWFVTASLLVSSLVLAINKSLIMDEYNKEVATNGQFSLTVTNGADLTDSFMASVARGTAFFELAPYIVLLIITALIFMNIYKVFRKSNTASPFSEENIKRIKTIGYLTIAIPVAKVVIQLICIAAIGSTNYDFSISLSEFAFGLVALSLAQYFAYGAQLEHDVDGLV